MAWQLTGCFRRGLLCDQGDGHVTGWLEWQDGARTELKLRGRSQGALEGKRVLLEASSGSSLLILPDPLRELDAIPKEVHGVERMWCYGLAHVKYGGCAAEGMEPVPGAPADVKLQRRPVLMLEWFCQYGRMSLEVIEPRFVEVDGSPLEEATLLNPSGPNYLLEGVYFVEDEGLTTGRPMRWAEEHQRPLNLLLANDLQEWPHPDQVTDEEVASEWVERVLDRLFDLRIVLEICEHYTNVNAYRMLLDDFLLHAVAAVPASDCTWTMHYDTLDRCAACRRELEGDLEDEDDEDEVDEDDVEDELEASEESRS